MLGCRNRRESATVVLVVRHARPGRRRSWERSGGSRVQGGDDGVPRRTGRCALPRSELRCRRCSRSRRTSALLLGQEAVGCGEFGIGQGSMLGLPCLYGSQAFFDSKRVFGRFVQPRRKADASPRGRVCRSLRGVLIQRDGELSNRHERTVAPRSYSDKHTTVRTVHRPRSGQPEATRDPSATSVPSYSRQSTPPRCCGCGGDRGTETRHAGLDRHPTPQDAPVRPPRERAVGAPEDKRIRVEHNELIEPPDPSLDRRSADFSTPAPLMLHGFFGINSSAVEFSANDMSPNAGNRCPRTPERGALEPAIHGVFPNEFEARAGPRFHGRSARICSRRMSA